MSDRPCSFSVDDTVTADFTFTQATGNCSKPCVVYIYSIDISLYCHC